jgi:hypothetical protein
MPRVKVGPALPSADALDVEIAQPRDLDIGALRTRWRNVFRRLPHLPRHLLFRILAYRLQADRSGDLDADSQRLLDCADSPEEAGYGFLEVAVSRCLHTWHSKVRGSLRSSSAGSWTSYIGDPDVGHGGRSSGRFSEEEEPDTAGPLGS